MLRRDGCAIMHPLRLVLGLALVATPALAKEIQEYVAAAPFKMAMPARPTFPERTFSIVDYGAVADGQTLNTEAFAKTIAACADAGGGHVEIPPGLWLTGPIELRSNVHLHVRRGALVQFTPDHTQYPLVKYKGERDYVVASPISGRNLKNIAITGEGIFDGAGDTWRPVKKEKTTEAQWKAFLDRGGVISADGKVWWPTKEAMEGEDYLRTLAKSGKELTERDYWPARDFKRPHLLLLSNCENVLLEGVTFRNSPNFVVYPSRCDNVTIREVNVFNEWWAQNGDGIDISASRNVVVYRCNVSAGDDGICMKSSGKPRDGEDAALHDVIIAECTVYRAHGGFVIGSNTDGGMKNVWCTTCTFVGTDIGIRVKSGIGRGGLVHDILAENIAMREIVNEAILFETSYENITAGSAKDTVDKKVSGAAQKVPEFKDFKIRNIVCNGAKTAISITGLTEQPVHDIRIEDSIISAKRGVHLDRANDITLKNVKIITPENPVMNTKNAERIQVL